MISWLWWLLVGTFHQHEWEQVEVLDVFWPCLDNPVAKDYVCRCRTCGRITSFRV